MTRAADETPTDHGQFTVSLTTGELDRHGGHLHGGRHGHGAAPTTRR